MQLRNQDSAKAEQALSKALDLDKNNMSALMLLSNVAGFSRGSAAGH